MIWKMVHHGNTPALIPAVFSSFRGIGHHPTRLFLYIGQSSLWWPCPFHFKQHTFRWVSLWTYFPFLRLYNSICKLANCDWICCIPKFVSWIGEAFNFIEISSASTSVPIFCCDNGNLKWGNSEAIYQSLCCSTLIYRLAYCSRHFNLWSKSHADSFTFCYISLTFVVDWACNLGFLNSLFIAFFISFSVAFGWVILYLIYQLSALSCNVVTSCTFFKSSSIIYCDFHIASATNQNCSGSSVPRPLNMGIFIAFIILSSGGGGGGKGVGVWDEGDGGGGVGRCGIPMISLFTFCGAPWDFFILLLYSSLSDTPKKWLYAAPQSRFIMNDFPLHVALVKSRLNINSMAYPVSHTIAF